MKKPYYLIMLIAMLFMRPVISNTRIIYPLLLIVIVIWGVSMYIRLIQQDMKNCVSAIVITCLLWIIIRIFKYASTGFALRMLWYMYYLPLLALPVEFMLLGYVICSGEQKKRLPWWWLALTALNTVLFVLVMTNDFHNLTFVIDLSRPDWDAVYTHGPVYDLIFAVFTFEFIITSVLISKDRLRKEPLPTITPFAAIIGLGIAYTLIYNITDLRIYMPEMTTFFVIMVCVFWENVLITGVIPSNSGYWNFFRNSTADISILDADRKPVYSTRGASPLPADLFADPPASYSVIPITAGFAVLHKDYARLESKRLNLESMRRALDARNKILERETEITDIMYSLSEKKKLYGQVDTAIGTKLDEITAIAEGLRNDDPDKTKKLSRLKLLIGYCKRKSNMLLSTDEKGCIPCDILKLAMNELAKDTGSIGITGQIFINCSAPVSYDVVSSILDGTDRLFNEILKYGSCSYFIQLSEYAGGFRLSVIADDFSFDPALIPVADIDQYHIVLEDQRLLVHHRFGGDHHAGD